MRIPPICAMALAIVGLTQAGCRRSEPATRATPTPPAVNLAVTNIESPAGLGAAEPFLAATLDGRLVLSWLEKAEANPAVLRMAIRNADGVWSSPSTVGRHGELFVNWADFPSVIAADERTFVAHWLEKTAGSPYAYHVKLAQSIDEGRTWSTAVMAHGDVSATEHGFVSLQRLDGRSVAVAWLDGRDTGGGSAGSHGGATGLRYAILDGSGRVSGETVLDSRVCDCCQTAMVRTAKGLVVAYRDRSADEVRDISVVYERGGVWSAPRPLAADGWRINACPVNGPQLDAVGDTVAAAWFAMAGAKPRVYVAFSGNAGETFGSPIAVDDGDPLGRVEVTKLDGDGAVVTWIENADGSASLRARLVRPDGPDGPSIEVSSTDRARSSGFPRQGRIGSAVYVAWTASQTPSRVRLAKLDSPE